MHDPKFEKDVQQKMEELVFTPPASVWLNVEKEVNKEKKRRFLPFWLFFLPASLLVGAGIIYFSTRPDPAKLAPSGSTLPPVKIESKRDNELVINKSDSSTNKSVQQEKFHPGQPAYDHSRGETAGLPRRHTTGQTAGAKHPATEDAPDMKDFPAKRSSHVKRNSPAAVQPAKPEENNTIIQSAKPEENNTIETDPLTLLAGKTGTAAQPFVHRSVSPQRSAIDRHAGAITASSLSSSSISSPSKSPAAAKTRLPEPRRPWEAGFAGGIGVSSLNQGLLDKSSVTSAAYANYFSAITGVPQTYVSNAQPDLSFWAGVLLQKSLRKDLSVSLGLHLHYYSSRIKTGKKVNSDLAGLQSPSTTPNNSFILGNGGLAAAGRAYPYYSPGNNETFTNRYYFLELPGSISWQVGHSKTMPLFWEGGFSLSYLVSSNSLYYNPKSGVFFKDGSVINRTQASIFTGLMVGLPLHGLRIQAGPQIQYGFTNLLNNQGAGGQHLLYGGIKFVFLPGKWKK